MNTVDCMRYVAVHLSVFGFGHSPLDFFIRLFPRSPSTFRYVIYLSMRKFAVPGEPTRGLPITPCIKCDKPGAPEQPSGSALDARRRLVAKNHFRSVIKLSIGKRVLNVCASPCVAILSTVNVLRAEGRPGNELNDSKSYLCGRHSTSQLSAGPLRCFH